MPHKVTFSATGWRRCWQYPSDDPIVCFELHARSSYLVLTSEADTIEFHVKFTVFAPLSQIGDPSRREVARVGFAACLLEWVFSDLADWPMLSYSREDVILAMWEKLGEGITDE